MQMSQKRTCNGCKALELNRCALNHSISPAKELSGVVVSYRPNEQCYKPMNNNDYCSAMEIEL